MSIVWIFREQRSGSTAFTNLVTTRLNRVDKFVNYPKDIEMIKNIPNPEDYVFSTHFYNFIDIMDVFDKPVTLIRCARRDRVERCLSYLLGKHRAMLIMNKNNPWNILRHDSISDYNYFVDALKPMVIPKKEIYDYLQRCTEMNQYWEENAVRYQNCTVFYEDLCTDIGVDLPMIGLTSVSILGTESVSIKLPPYKNELCINYDMVTHWIKEYYSENRI
jgi:hypothetical protein